MNRLLPFLLSFGVALAVGGESFAGKPGVLLDAMSALPGLPVAELQKRLQSAHAEVNAALGERADRLAILEDARGARDAAAVEVEQMKEAGIGGEPLQLALREALVLDEEYTLSRSALVSSEGRVAKEGAGLLRVYDAILLHKRQQALRHSAGSSARKREVQAYRAVAKQRDGVRRLLQPVLRPTAPSGRSALADVQASEDDDIETLLEKADLARDLEERFLRQAETVRRRIHELEEEHALARDVIGMVQAESLFDESDRRLVLVRPNVGAAPATGLPRSNLGGSALAAVSREGADSASAFGGGPGNRQDESGEGLGAGAAPEPEAAPAAPPPADPGAPQDDLDSADGAEEQEIADLGLGGDDSDGSNLAGPEPLAPTDVGPVLGTTEQAFLGGGLHTALTLSELMASGQLTLPQLKAYEKRLRRQAKRLRRQGRTLQSEAHTRGRR